jgi:hypothetical protein
MAIKDSVNMRSYDQLCLVPFVAAFTVQRESNPASLALQDYQ